MNRGLRASLGDKLIRIKNPVFGVQGAVCKSDCFDLIYNAYWN